MGGVIGKKRVYLNGMSHIAGLTVYWSKKQYIRWIGLKGCSCGEFDKKKGKCNPLIWGNLYHIRLIQALDLCKNISLRKSFASLLRHGCPRQSGSIEILAQRLRIGEGRFLLSVPKSTIKRSKELSMFRSINPFVTGGNQGLYTQNEKCMACKTRIPNFETRLPKNGLVRKKQWLKSFNQALGCRAINQSMLRLISFIKSNFGQSHSTFR